MALPTVRSRSRRASRRWHSRALPPRTSCDSVGSCGRYAYEQDPVLTDAPHARGSHGADALCSGCDHRHAKAIVRPVLRRRRLPPRRLIADSDRGRFRVPAVRCARARIPLASAERATRSGAASGSARCRPSRGGPMTSNRRLPAAMISSTAACDSWRPTRSPHHPSCRPSLPRSRLIPSCARCTSAARPMLSPPDASDSPNTPPASQRFATIKYDVNERGQVVPSSVEILDSSDRELVDAIRAALARARFRAAEQGCRPITMTVVQTFRG